MKDHSKNLASVNEKMRRLGLKLTKQRMIICEIFFRQKGHSSAEQILREVRKREPRLSLATVYRTLKILQHHGFASAHNFKDGQALFEPKLPDSDHHDHLICTNCNQIIEFVDEEIESLQTRVAESHGFLMTNHKMELYGLCDQCRD